MMNNVPAQETEEDDDYDEWVSVTLSLVTTNYNAQLNWSLKNYLFEGVLISGSPVILVFNMTGRKLCRLCLLRVAYSTVVTERSAFLDATLPPEWPSRKLDGRAINSLSDESCVNIDCTFSSEWVGIFAIFYSWSVWPPNTASCTFMSTDSVFTKSSITASRS